MSTEEDCVDVAHIPAQRRTFAFVDRVTVGPEVDAVGRVAATAHIDRDWEVRRGIVGVDHAQYIGGCRARTDIVRVVATDTLCVATIDEVNRAHAVDVPTNGRALAGIYIVGVGA